MAVNRAKSASKAEKPATTPWKYRISIRLPERAPAMADSILARVGVGDRTDVFRKAALYGLAAFDKNPGLLRRVDDQEA